MHVLERQRLLMQGRRLHPGPDTPRPRRTNMVVVAQRFAVGGLILFAEMAAAGLVAIERIDAHQFAQLEEIGHAAGLLERLVDLVGARAP